MPEAHSWKFFTTTVSAWEAMLDSCKHAKHSIDLEQFVLGRDGKIVRRFVDLFKDKVKAGVRVRLLLDAVGSFAFYRSGLPQELLAAGVEVAFHRGVTPPSLKRLFPMILRDHRKLLVVDRAEAHIGGVIIEARAETWRDTSVLIRGSVVQELERAFETVWKYSRRMKPVGSVLSPRATEFSIAGNSFHLHDKHLYRAFLRSIVAAKKYVYITTPYFSPNKEFRRALYYAHDKGVDVRILLPKQSDNFIADHIARLYYPKLLRHGVRLFLYTPFPMLHAKTIVIDDHWSSVGSCNFDWLSFWLNYELNIVSANRLFASELHDHFLTDLKHAEELFL